MCLPGPVFVSHSRCFAVRKLLCVPSSASGRTFAAPPHCAQNSASEVNLRTEWDKLSEADRKAAVSELMALRKGKGMISFGGYCRFCGLYGHRLAERRKKGAGMQWKNWSRSGGGGTKGG